MSHISTRPEQSTSAEITVLTNLAALAVSGTGEFIRKTGATTFANATPEEAGSFSVATPSGTVDGVNTTFAHATQPLFLISDGAIRIEGVHYTYTGTTIEITDGAPPVQYLRAFVTT